jgi:hypothetical protein
MTDRKTAAAAVRSVRELTENVRASTRKYPQSRERCSPQEFPPAGSYPGINSKTELAK